MVERHSSQTGLGSFPIFFSGDAEKVARFFNLRFLQRLSVDEVSQELGVPVSEVQEAEAEYLRELRMLGAKQ